MSDSFIFIFGFFVYLLAVVPLIYVLVMDARDD
jgi:hypothetical protein